MMQKATCLVAGLALAAGITGCRVHVDKGANGEDKTVQVDTPFGGVHVNTDQTTASDLGLPVYPGAQEVKATTSTSQRTCTWALASGSCGCRRFPMRRPITRSR